MSVTVPTGWDFVEQSLNGPAPNIAVQAVSGLAHVLTAVNLYLFIGGGATILLSLEAIFGANTYPLGLMSAVTGTSEVYALNWTGEIMAATGAQLNVEMTTLSGGGGNYDWTLEAQGHDV